jgi:small subunit ribosomal protein S27Ae
MAKRKPSKPKKEEEKPEEPKEEEKEEEVVEVPKEEPKKEKKRKGKKPRKNRTPSKKWIKYKISEGKIERGKICPKCGPGVYLGEHKNRFHCGRCNYTEFKEKSKAE